MRDVDREVEDDAERAVDRLVLDSLTGSVRGRVATPTSLRAGRLPARGRGTRLPLRDKDDDDDALLGVGAPPPPPPSLRSPAPIARRLRRRPRAGGVRNPQQGAQAATGCRGAPIWTATAGAAATAAACARRCQGGCGLRSPLPAGCDDDDEAAAAEEEEHGAASGDDPAGQLRAWVWRRPFGRPAASAAWAMSRMWRRRSSRRLRQWRRRWSRQRTRDTASCTPS